MLRALATALLLMLPILLPAAEQLRSGFPLAPDHVRVEPSRDGGTLRFDGVFYDYADAERRIALKLWVPPTRGPIRGILFHGNPGFSDGDSRGECFSPVYRMFAARHGFAIMGATWLYSGDVFARTGRQLLSVLDQWAELGAHPELREAPLLPMGNSNGGATACNLALVAPERTIAFAANVPSPRWQALDQIPPAAWRVPGLILVGPRDAPHGVLLAHRAWLLGRVNGALWAWSCEQDKGHAMGSSMAATMSFLDAVIGMRLPERGAAKSEGLRPLAFEDGWMMHTYAGEWAPAYIMPGERPEPVKFARSLDFGWVPNEDVARVLQAVSTFGRPYRVLIEGAPDANSPEASGAHLRNAEGRVVSPDEPLHVRIDGPALQTGESLTLRAGARVLHTFSPGEDLAFTFHPPGDRAVLALAAELKRPQGGAKLAIPAWCVVAEPSVADALAAQDAAYENSLLARRAVVEAPGDADGVQAGSGVLLARPAPSADAASSPSRLWTAAEGGARVDLCEEAPAKAEPPPAVEARTLWTEAGLILLWRLPAAERDVELDFHLVRQSPSGIWNKSPANFVAVGRTLALQGAQYQFKPDAGDSALRLGFAHGFHWRDDLLLPAQAAGRGFSTQVEDTAGGDRFVKILIPWTHVGTPARVDAPPAGAQFAVVLGFNLGKRKFRWPFGRNPWQTPIAAGPEKSPWGSVVLAR